MQTPEEDNPLKTHKHLGPKSGRTISTGYGFTLGVRAFEAWLYTFMSYKSH